MVILGWRSKILPIDAIIPRVTISMLEMSDMPEGIRLDAGILLGAGHLQVHLLTPIS